MSDQAFVTGILDILKEAVEGGEPGKGTAFLDGTKADGSGNHGLLATLDGLGAEQASRVTALGTTVASQAAHTAYHMEVVVRWERGDRGPFDWPNSFQPSVVDEDAWRELRDRVRRAYQDLRALATSNTNWDGDEPGGLAGALAHVTYHLGAVRQLIKLAR
ncbi:DinB family protein [Deinococcus yavapaiensis]|uniref:DinB family protein n=1 Tax=Deinococcus yavapaiensis KR-236 TaxID=694435 RepID=A0A318SBH9_9DEIO|nr:DinB family protein [Deinococcus yavapaiensis]PYE55932.1 hypothetical protein DES52_102299 [Deinococcus yavapaiensis KR-236]